MLYRSLGTSARADHPLDTNSVPSWRSGAPGEAPGNTSNGYGCSGIDKGVLHSGDSSSAPESATCPWVVRRSASWRIGVHRTQVRAFLVCMERYNLAVVSGVFNARDAMQKKGHTWSDKDCKTKKQAIHTIIVIVEGW